MGGRWHRPSCCRGGAGSGSPHDPPRPTPAPGLPGLGAELLELPGLGAEAVELAGLEAELLELRGMAADVLELRGLPAEGPGTSSSGSDIRRLCFSSDSETSPSSPSSSNPSQCPRLKPSQCPDGIRPNFITPSHSILPTQHSILLAVPVLIPRALMDPPAGRFRTGGVSWTIPSSPNSLSAMSRLNNDCSRFATPTNAVR